MVRFLESAARHPACATRAGTLADAAQHGRLVVFCGSGPSKGAPSYLPDWRSLNQFVLDEARAAGLRALPGLSSSSGAAVESLSLTELPVASFSDQLVTLAAGSTWFEFLRLLDSEQTNAGHRALAELAEAGTLAAIASTNFDTLIERAFGERCYSFCGISWRCCAASSRGRRSDHPIAHS